MIKLIGIPFDANSSFLKGPAIAPVRIRLMEKDGSANCYSENGYDISAGSAYEDGGDIVFEDSDPTRAFDKIRSVVATHIRDKTKIISLGGDHSISYPLIDAYSSLYPELHVLHLDAHGDLYENFDNNPYSHASPFARILEKGKIKSLIQVGIRSLTPHQKQQALKYGVQQIEMKDFTLNFISRLKTPLYVSLDLDVLDPAYAPGVSHHEPGGLTSRELLSIIQNLPQNIVGADIVEYNPVRDVHNMTAMVAYKLFKELVAKMLP